MRCCFLCPTYVRVRCVPMSYVYIHSYITFHQRDYVTFTYVKSNKKFVHLYLGNKVLL